MSAAREHNRVLMSYEQKSIDLENDHKREAGGKKVVIHEAIDDIVERLKHSIQLKDQLSHTLKVLGNISKYSVENLLQIDELSHFFKERGSSIYKLLHQALHEGVIDYEEKRIDEDSINKLNGALLSQEVYDLIFNQFTPNPLKLKHFSTNFYNVAPEQFEQSDKHPMYKGNELKRFRIKNSA